MGKKVYVLIIMATILILTACSPKVQPSINEVDIKPVEPPKLVEETGEDGKPREEINLDGDVLGRLAELAEKYNMNKLEHIEIQPEVDRYLMVFESKYCQACKMFLPTLFEYINSNESTQLYLVNVDTDKTLEMVQKYELEATPTTILIENGETIKKHEGLMTLEQLTEFAK